MDVLFYVVPGLMTVGASFFAYRALRRWWQLRGAWKSGLTAEGRCLRMFTTTHGGGNDTAVRTRIHHVYEFTARDGRSVRFEEEDGPTTVLEGDFVTVYYREGHDVVATALPPNHAKQAVSTIALLAFAGVIVAFCVSFMVTYEAASSEFDSVTSDFGGF